MAAQERGRWYRHVDAALLRASAHTGDVVPECWPDFDDETKIEQWCAWLGEVWAQAPVAEAIAVASPVLADRVEAVCAGLRPEAGQVRRMIISVVRYLVRMRGRATPVRGVRRCRTAAFRPAGIDVLDRWAPGADPGRWSVAGGGDRPAGVLARTAAAPAGHGE